MTETTFFRLLDGADRPARLLKAVRNLREGDDSPDAHHADPDSFRQVPGSPFAYWVSEEVREKFVDLQPVESGNRTAKQGLATANDFRFVRTSWEVEPVNVAYSNPETLVKKWVPFAKGGDYSPYYSDVHLLVNWHRDGSEIKGQVGPSGKLEARPQNTSYYFRPGLTWPRRTSLGISVRVLPEGCIFADKGPAAFSTSTDLLVLLALMNSRAFGALVALHMGAAHTAARSYEVGVIQRTPVPDIPAAEAERLGGLAFRCVDLKRNLDSANETSHAFHLPALLQVDGGTLAERVAAWRGRVTEAERELAGNQREIDDLAFGLYGITGGDRAAMEGAGDGASHPGEDGGGGDTDEPEVAAPVDGASLAADLISYAVGCAFGRWDVRMAHDPSLAPKLADPFSPLPVCSPGTLTGPDSMPVRLGFSGGEVASEEWLRARPDAITVPEEASVASPSIPQDEYPIEIDRDGILADDPDRPDDIVRRVRGVFESVFGENADGIEADVCGMLGVKDLRSYFANPRKFFDYHTKRYSRSRRKAPIYWLIQSPKRRYGLWIYYHRLDPDLVYKALTRYVDPKIRFEEDRLSENEATLREISEAGGSPKQAEKAIAARQDLLADLREFRVRLARAANLDLAPDLNDGVVLNIAPLHETVPWKEANTRWEELISGKHEWSHVGRHLRRRGLV